MQDTTPRSHLAGARRKSLDCIAHLIGAGWRKGPEDRGKSGADKNIKERQADFPGSLAIV
jgi:hypothetical protein